MARSTRKLQQQIKRKKSDKRSRMKTASSSSRHKASLPQEQALNGVEKITIDAADAKRTHPFDHAIPYESRGLLNRLVQDHEHIWSLFEAFQTAGGDDKVHLVNKLIRELEVHTNIEDELFYSELVKHGDKETQLLVREARANHEGFQAIADQLKTLSFQEGALDSGVEKLMQQVQCHVEEEERVLFPLAQDLLAEKLEKLGAAMIERKTILLPSRIVYVR